MLNSKITCQSSFNGHPIQADPETKMGCHSEILESGLDLFNDMVQRHSRVLCVRFDLRFPQSMACPGDNAVIQRFMENYALSLRRQGFDPSYLWVREDTHLDRFHYHVMLLLDGHKTQYAYYHMELAERLWLNAIGNQDIHGLVYRCPANREDGVLTDSLMIDRSSPDYPRVFDHAFRWFSYMAKTSTKERTPERIRNFGRSRRRE